MAGVYVTLLIASHLFCHFAIESRGSLPEQKVTLIGDPATADALPAASLSVAYVDLPGSDPDAPVILLLHGAPAGAFDLHELARRLQGPYRVICPDLPGFGRSSKPANDYSPSAQAARIAALLEQLGVERCHLVGFSMGGVAAIWLAHREQGKILSLTLISSPGVQEFDLFGHHGLNRSIYAVQLYAIRLARALLPHFGLLDLARMTTAYARTLYEADLRPVRRMLDRLEAPVLIIHGRGDPFVPLAAALEHHRLLPQSEIEILEGAHFLVYQRADLLEKRIRMFLGTVEEGSAARRATAPAERREAAYANSLAAGREPLTGLAEALMMTIIGFSTLISEDLACIGAGLLVSHGALSFRAAALASFIGIFVGDVLLYLAGRFMGRPALKRAPFRWFVREQAIEEAAEWFARRGPAVILASRFLPGSRFPTYFTAGVLRQPFWAYALFFFIAGAVWAPLLVWFASVMGEGLIDLLRTYKFYTVGGVLAGLLAIWLTIELIIPLFTFRGRRLLAGRWHRLIHCEYWPTWTRYVPLLPYLFALAARHKGLTVFTAANPCMPMGGVAGESKLACLGTIRQIAPEHVARFEAIVPGISPERALEQASEFLRRNALSYPLVVKPDGGERGAGVAILRGEDHVIDYFSRPRPLSLFQEYVPGLEFGVFYYRYPDQPRGAIYAVTIKQFHFVTGDGHRTLEELILRDPRGAAMADYFLRRHRRRLYWVPPAGERVQISEIGNHCRGAIFRHGAHLITPALTEAIDAIGRRLPGFYFGRFDLRTPSEEDLRNGRNFKIIELNGVTSEATIHYDPDNRAIDMWRILARQWKIAFEIGALNRDRGIRTAGVFEILDMLAHRPPVPEADD